VVLLCGRKTLCGGGGNPVSKGPNILRSPPLINPGNRSAGMICKLHHNGLRDAGTHATGDECHASAMKTDIAHSQTIEESPPSDSWRSLSIHGPDVWVSAARELLQKREQATVDGYAKLPPSSSLRFIDQNFLIRPSNLRLGDPSIGEPESSQHGDPKTCPHPVRISAESFGDNLFLLRGNLRLQAGVHPGEPDLSAWVFLGESSLHSFPHYTPKQFQFSYRSVDGWVSASMGLYLSRAPLGVVEAIFSGEGSRAGDLFLFKKHVEVIPSGSVGDECARLGLVFAGEPGFYPSPIVGAFPKLMSALIQHLALESILGEGGLADAVRIILSHIGFFVELLPTAALPIREPHERTSGKGNCAQVHSGCLGQLNPTGQY
jgi:hypothetical protein